MKQLVCHVGFPKTGTTFLQRAVFPKLNLNYVPYHECQKLFLPIIYKDSLDYDDLELRCELNESKTNALYSYEMLVGDPFLLRGANKSQIAMRLKNLGFQKIIITIRNQTEIIDSLYRQYINQGGIMTFDDFLDIDNKNQINQSSFYKEYLDYYNLINHYIKVFGKGNVLILTQEELKADLNNYLNQLKNFLEIEKIDIDSVRKIKENESMVNLSVRLIRLANFFLFSSQRPSFLISPKLSTRNFRYFVQLILQPLILRKISRKKSFSKPYERFIKIYYRESNKKLQGLVSLNLKDLDYQ